jgi:tRNA-specific 2-thiouridylase
MSRIFVGMSGGVDSSLTAALMVEAGHDVTGVFMKNWSKDIGGWRCSWQDDYLDAKRVAAQLGIELKLYDFQAEYKQAVVDYLLDEYKAGNTPNPDIMCNQEIKFKLFLETALKDGAEKIATGHYARIVNGSELHMAVDTSKDQSYFLARVSSEALEKTLFPLGEMKKSLVREEAKKRDLITANKKDSVGICFVGQVGIREFLREYVDDIEPGDIIDNHGEIIGQHEGAIFYTIGQRQGLGVGGGLPYYVTHKDMDKNIVYVTTDPSDNDLWSSTIKGSEAHWINQPPEDGKTYQVRTRHLGSLTDCKLIKIDKYNYEIKLAKDKRALAPGQSAVIYSQAHCLGALVIS